ncbi:hypothetical protein [Microbacterium cremeum]|uniref:hypothetical protein n=1 Tax=Microbacterium cremeum TaxID=2782169 RepID=UPI001889BAAA|nr:hypothetical protein [Microbacterium cremeum]
MRSRGLSQPHRWDMQLGELSISGRIVGYVYFRASRSGVEWNANRSWRLSKVQDAWVETQEWFIAPDGGMSSYAGDNVGPEEAFANLGAGKYTALLSQLDPLAAQEAGAGTEVEVDFRWVTDEERDQLLTRLLAI